MFEFDQDQRALELGSDLSEVFACGGDISDLDLGLWGRVRRLGSPAGTVRNGTTELMTYFNTGNIKSKYNVAGDFNYDRFAPASCNMVAGSAIPGAFALTRIGTTEKFCYDSRGNQLASFLNDSIKREISYSSFDAATVIRSTTPRAHVTRFGYGAGHQRLRRYDMDGSNLTESSAGKVTHYAGDAEVTTKPDGTTEVRRYVSGMTQVQVIPAVGTVLTRREYLVVDALGSTHRIVSEAGVIVTDGKQAFATFGERASAEDRSTLTEAQQANFNALLPRGYTGHQQADEVGVIHMNGRIYDPRLGRFLQADSLIEDLFDPQAINSYSYVRNNPMNATDPTGHWRAKEQGILRQAAALAITISAGIHINTLLSSSAYACLAPSVYAAAATTAALAGAASGALTTGTLKGTLIGALGALTFQQIGLSSLETGPRIAAHAIAGGALEALGGGSFGHGFVSAGLNKALSPLAEGHAFFTSGLIEAAIGGTISEITGGDFANGAALAATQYAFNALTQFAADQTLEYNKETSKFAVNGTPVDCPSPMGCWGLAPPSTAASRAEGAAFAGQLAMMALPVGRFLQILGRAKYFISDGVRRSIVALNSGQKTVDAILVRPGMKDMNLTVRIKDLFSPKSAVVRDARFNNINPPIQRPIEVQPRGLPGQGNSIPLSDVKLVPGG
jgi:RHS repeat-associated protein